MGRVSLAGLFTALFLIAGLIPMAGCSGRNEGFAIYYPVGNIAPRDMPPLAQIVIPSHPVISQKDILEYRQSTHEIMLTAKAFRRVTDFYHVPMSGLSFVACVDRSPVYWGAFWVPISSLSFDGVAIMAWPSDQKANVIQITLGYPAPAFFKGTDPRGDERIMNALQKAGKLK